MKSEVNVIAANVENILLPIVNSKIDRENTRQTGSLPEILLLTSYPPRECGIATYSQDLLIALNNKFSNTFSLKVCALEAENANHVYPNEVKYILNTNDSKKYHDLVATINKDRHIKLVMVQHEFGLFHNNGDNDFLQLLFGLNKPVIVVFHTVLPRPDQSLKSRVRNIAGACDSVIVMTNNAAKILKDDYGLSAQKIVVIAHGTHLVPHLNKNYLKEKYGLNGRKVLSTFGLLSSGKGIETTLNALQRIIKINPDIMFLVIGKTHPGVIKSEGEIYRNTLESLVKEFNLSNHVKFINRYLLLEDLLEYLQLTDIYLFTSRDPNQAVSGTFSYAMSCACPIISTPIPHANEILRDDTGIIIDFQNSQQLADGVNRLMSDEPLRKSFSSNALHRIVPTAWENSAVEHALLLQKVIRQSNVNDADLVGGNKISLQYRLPDIKLDHIKKLTTDFGMIQFSKINQPDIESGYTLDDNARALIAMCMHIELTGDKGDMKYIQTYLDFIRYCLQPDGFFLNYVDIERRFTKQNYTANLSDANGRAIWALGFIISKRAVLPEILITKAEEIMRLAICGIDKMHSTRAMAFTIKGLYYFNLELKSTKVSILIKTLADRLVQMYRHESEQKWQWYESYLTYANSILPEALLFAWIDSGDENYKSIAKESFDFLLSLTFKKNRIKVISNKSWMQKGAMLKDDREFQHGEQPIDVAYTILAINSFYKVYKEENYFNKMETAFNWFLGKNHLHQIIYNPCTGGCYDGLEENNVNLNQGAESTVSYLLARLTVERKLNIYHKEMSYYENAGELIK